MHQNTAFFSSSSSRMGQPFLNHPFTTTAATLSSITTQRHLSTSSINNHLINYNDEITSAKSNTVKYIKKLKDKKKSRAESKQTIIEGIRLVTDVLLYQPTLVSHVLCTNEILSGGGGGNNEEVKYLIQLLQEQQENVDRISLISDDVIKACADTVTPQGVVAVVDIPPIYSPSSLTATATTGSTAPNPLYLVLDGLSDPGNVGTLLRSSLAVSVTAVLLVHNSCDVWNPKAIRSAMGATFRIPIRRFDTFDNLIDFLNVDCGVNTKERFYAATMDVAEEEGPETEKVSASSSPAYYEVGWAYNNDNNANLGGSNPAVLCLGKEGEGLHPEIREALSKGNIKSVHVPMEPGSMESLNAAVCGSVVLFEYLRQKRVYGTYNDDL